MVSRGTFPVKFLIEITMKDVNLILQFEPSLSLESSVELILNFQRLCTGLWILYRLSQ